MSRLESSNAEVMLEKMDELNEDAARLNIRMRTRANSPAQQPWHKPEKEDRPKIAKHALSAGVHAEPYLWRWRDIKPYLEKVAEMCPIEFTERQQLHLLNPGFGGELRIANSIRAAISIYKPGDTAPVHVHTPNATRTILSSAGGHSIVEGERCDAERGDIIVTPNGAWHGHGNDDDDPVVWLDILDWPLMEFLDSIWVDSEPPEDVRTSEVPSEYSAAVYGSGGIIPRFINRSRGSGAKVTPQFHFRGRDIANALEQLSLLDADPYDGAVVEVVDPTTGAPPFPSLSYRARRLEAGHQTLRMRHTASTVYCVLEGKGTSLIGKQRFEWGPNDVFVVPNHTWQSHHIEEGGHAVLYTVSDAPLLKMLGQFRAQGRSVNGEIQNLDASARG
ncbi:MAG: cupin domain-containing protein [Gammaproteobacteria bacterium]|nr:cupin domain-containing protein [Gammaproteobacteria bacterium]MDH3466428.1 cupin domain-containing protein [Gammaproteobacteria bacterium]